MSSLALVIEDDETLAENVCIFLERNGWEAHYCLTAEEALKSLETTHPDIVISDVMLPGLSGLQLMEKINEMDRDLRVIFMTGSERMQTAVDAMKLGAADYLTKPVALAELKLSVERALGCVQMERTLSAHNRRQAEKGGLKRLIGSAPTMEEVKVRIRQILDAESRLVGDDLPAVLVTGETGTGKEVVARALHFDGSRATQPFVEVNCAAIPDHLLESELFGHERGAFTDAKERKVGLVESAEGGTLFLDEIGETDLNIQAKLLKFLEDRTVRRIGSVRARRVNVRIVSATNRDLAQLVQEGLFRSDLYFRLRIIEVKIPPLRERGADVLELGKHFLKELGRRYGKRDMIFSQDAERMLMGYHWPGNVRELRNMLEETVLLASHPVIMPEQLALCSRAMGNPVAAAQVAPQECMNNCSTPLGGTRFGPIRGRPEDPDREEVVRVLERTDWNVSKSAKLLGLSRDMLRYRIEKFGLERPN
ncbi:MAG: sigma-54-dependent Fis family transcriptional regulator [Rhodocyclaceae bacterium]|nr:sigma-54-dependent Fis family transcriptional regulator [Rhodocyclaceae bacterium]